MVFWSLSCLAAYDAADANAVANDAADAATDASYANQILILLEIILRLDNSVGCCICTDSAVLVPLLNYIRHHHHFKIFIFNYGAKEKLQSFRIELDISDHTLNEQNPI